ncbi:MAG: hypothetical protein AAGD38_16705 [Acidobacteriota bacterium]
MTAAGGLKLDCRLETGEIYSSTLGLLLPSPSGIKIVTSGHAVGDQGATIMLADGTTIGHVSHNAYLHGPVGNPDGHSTSNAGHPRTGRQPSSGSSSHVDIAVGDWSFTVLGLPLTVFSRIEQIVTLPVPIIGTLPPTVSMPITISGADGGSRLGVVLETDTTVTDADTQTKVSQVAVGAYASDRIDSGAPVWTLNPDPTDPTPMIVGFHGGRVESSSEDAPSIPRDAAGARSWFVPWLEAQRALELPPLPPAA